MEILIRQLQEQKSMLQDDNARLQSKIKRLNKAAPAVQAAQVRSFPCSVVRVLRSLEKHTLQPAIEDELRSPEPVTLTPEQGK